MTCQNYNASYHLQPANCKMHTAQCKLHTAPAPELVPEPIHFILPISQTNLNIMHYSDFAHLYCGWQQQWKTTVKPRRAGCQRAMGGSDS